jgi:hypothetical protein
MYNSPRGRVNCVCPNNPVLCVWDDIIGLPRRRREYNMRIAIIYMPATLGALKEKNRYDDRMKWHQLTRIRAG